MSWVRFNVRLETLQVISGTIFSFPTNTSTGAKHLIFSTNHLAYIDKTKRNYNQIQQKYKQPPKKNYIKLGRNVHRVAQNAPKLADWVYTTVL